MHLSELGLKYSLFAQVFGSEYRSISPENPQVNEIICTNAQHTKTVINTISKPLHVTIATARLRQRSEIQDTHVSSNGITRVFPNFF
jgi:hypothetical protein